MSENTGYILSEPATRWTWKNRLRVKLFPFTICHIPEAPASFQDVIVTKCRADLSFVDRLRVLITGKVETETRIVTQNMVGDHKSNSVVRCGRFF